MFVIWMAQVMGQNRQLTPIRPTLGNLVYVTLCHYRRTQTVRAHLKPLCNEIGQPRFKQETILFFQSVVLLKKSRGLCPTDFGSIQGFRALYAVPTLPKRDGDTTYYASFCSSRSPYSPFSTVFPASPTSPASPASPAS
eukprot:SAG11_NODE_4080_length_2074_cov_1.967089_2_plen_139_part_00